MPLTVPLVAVTVALATGVSGAVSSPAAVIVPAVVAQVNRRLQSQRRAELVLGRGRVLLRAAGVQIDRRAG